MVSGVSGVVSTGVVVSGAVRSISPPPVAISVQPATTSSSAAPTAPKACLMAAAYPVLTVAKLCCVVPGNAQTGR